MTAPVVLELDMGNSAIKWRKLEGHARVAGGRLGSIAEVPALLVPPLSLVRVASVADPARDQQLAALLSQHGVAHRFAKTQSACAGVTNAYQDVSRMGVDRWLAMLAAFQDCAAPCMVIDAGTALTIDILADGGRHLGGYIIPGARLMAAALGRETGRVRFDEHSLLGLQPGVTTEQCVHHGKWLALAGSVRSAIEMLETQWGGEFPVFITGGDAPLLCQLLPERAPQWRYREELVMEGLSLALADGQGA